MRISVTQQHINDGVRGSCTSDPISLAMKDAGLLDPWVSPVRISWQNEFSSYYAVRTPKTVLQFMKDFDNGKYCPSFVFELEG